jgi:parallel beta-helix repeat protein
MGIWVWGCQNPPVPSHHNVIENNSIFNNTVGIWIISSKENYIRNNTIYNNSGIGGYLCGDGIELNGDNNIISGNKFYNDGIHIEFDYSQIIENNTVNDKPLYYYKNQDDFAVPSDAGQIILVNCNKVTIDGVNITRTGPGILSVLSSDIIISNSNFSYNRICVILHYSRDVIIKHNEFFFNNGSDGEITLYRCNILLEGGKNVLIQENNISFTNPDVTNSIIITYGSNQNVIKNNTILFNHERGIYTQCSTHDNTIYHNNFVGNSANARDDGSSNQWDNGYPTGGNFWDDYDGHDENNDGIGDTPYDIPGENNSIDRYPLMAATWTWNVPPNKPNKPSGNTSGKPGETLNFTTNTTDYDGDQVFYMWDWDDGTYSEWLGPFNSGENATANHSWNEKSKYNIRVKAKDIYGQKSPWSDPLQISVPYNINMVVSKKCVVLGQSTVQFQCLVTGGSEPYNFEWDFGDGNTSDDQNTTYTFNDIGDYVVTLTVTDNESNSYNETVNIDVMILKADFNTSILKCSKTDETIYFNDTSEGYYEIVNWSWDFGDGSVSYEQNSSHKYTAGGFYRVVLTIIDNESNTHIYNQIMHIDSFSPVIYNVSNTPDTVGLGFNVSIKAGVHDLAGRVIGGVDNVKINISYPNGSSNNCTMSNECLGNVYEYVFGDTWLVGQYNFTIWVIDKAGNRNSSSGHNFSVSAQATVSVCTIKDEYETNETLNLTDPPAGSLDIGYELLDEGEVLHIWNRFDSYYFNTSSGIQLTNHYDEYWSHNVLMLGYYNNEGWNLIYRTDELSGFNKNITSNEYFVNATLWKDLSYNGFDFRLAIRYILGADDSELTVIPYIKNIDNVDIPYVLGFGWEMKDIQIGMTEVGDYIRVNRSMFYLNQTLDNVYTNLSETEFYIMENITNTRTKSLYLKWNQSLTYKLRVESREGQYNAPVTLFVRIGTLKAGQEKYTLMYWYDADQLTFYFNSYNTSEAWSSNPGYMVDGSTSNYASTTSEGDVELCNGNNCSGADRGTISKVELRVCSYFTVYPCDTILRPVFNGTSDGNNITYQTPPVSGEWSSWFDITNDPSAPQSWGWSDVEGLDVDVEAGQGMPGFTLFCSRLEVRVTYAPAYSPEISDPYPANGCNGVSISPVLNITVSDQNGDNMNITWLSNSNGSWITFGTNNSVGNGTYHQTMSNASVNGQWWYWKVNVTDGTDSIESSVHKFYTGCQSKLVNTGSTNIKGYLLIQVQFYNETSENWVVADDTINESTPRTVLWEDPAGAIGQHIFGLDTVFNGLVNTSNLLAFGNGTYRIYAAFRDPDGDVLVCDDETLMEDSYEFTLSGS